MAMSSITDTSDSNRPKSGRLPRMIPMRFLLEIGNFPIFGVYHGDRWSSRRSLGGTDLNEVSIKL
jgi:hypothetical protein